MTIILKTLSFSSLIALLSLSGCAPMQQWRPDDQPKVYKVAMRQLPPQPVYNRLRMVEPPEILPPRELPLQTGPMVMPVFSVDLKNTNLEKVGSLLADTARYTSYCASSIATKKISLHGVGTLDELASTVAKQANVNVVVDHDNREIRILADAAPFDAAMESPKFSE